MKILIPCSYYYPEQCAGIYIIDNLVQKAAFYGIKSKIIAPWPTRNVPKGANWERNEHLCDGLINIHRFPMYGEGKNPVLRALRYFFCEIAQLHYLLWEDYDVAFVDSTPPIRGLLFPIVKLIKDKAIVYNLQDIFPDSLVGTGLAKKDGFLWNIGRRIENITYRNADKIIVISQDFKKNIIAKGVSNEKIVVIYNWVDETAIKDIPRLDNKLFDKYNLDRGLFYLTYSGNIGLTQNMDLLLDVMEDIQQDHPNIHLVLIGEGAYKNEVIKRIGGRKEKNGAIHGTSIRNITVLPFQPYEDLSYVFSLGDAGLVISKPGVGENSVPSKTWSIMSASRPVLANFDENELKDIIEDYRCGIFTKSGYKEAFKASILELYNNPSLCEDFGRNGRQFVEEKLTKEVGTQQYINVLKSLDKN